MNLDSRGPTTNCESENDGLGLRGVGVGDGGDINIVSSSHPAPSPQSRRESLLDGLISTSRRSFATMERSMDTVGSIDTTETGKSSSPGGGGGGARTGINLEQIEEVDIEDSIRPTPISTVPIPPYTPIFGAEGRRMPSAGTAVTGGTTTVESRRSIFITETIAGRYNEEQLNEKLVQVNIKNFSYFIPEKMDRPSVPTVFNQSVFYATFEVGRRVTKYVQSKIGEKKSNHGRTTVNPPEQHTNTAGGDDIDAVEVVGEVVDPSSMSWTPTTAQDIVYPYSKRPVLKDVNLVLKPGNTYLVLGPPGCGKTSLLKAVANRLRYAGNSEDECLPNQPHLEGRIEYNGVATTDTDLVVQNICSFVGQLDNHAPYLTVRETFDFAFQCRTGAGDGVVSTGSKANSPTNVHMTSTETGTETAIQNMGYGTAVGGGTDTTNNDDRTFTENLTIKGLDLSVCADTFVGNESVRGVSGGQRRRVTVGEMMQGAAPVACADEISTGLDAQVTYDIIHSIVAFAKAAKTTRIVSLLQPGPETFALFDEVILMAKGMIIFAGPITEIVGYFNALGYKQPATMDVADWLVSIPTPDGKLFTEHEHYTAFEFHERFKKSRQMARIQSELQAPPIHSWLRDPGAAVTPDNLNIPGNIMIPYHNTFSRSMMLNLRRHFTLWIRDKGFIIGKMFENIGMAVATGGILFGQAKVPDGLSGLPRNEEEAEEYSRIVQAVYGALFMTCLHILLGTMTSAPDEIDGRSIHYKQYDANFYQVFAFVFGRLLSTIPQRTIEIVSFGIPLYWMVGLDPTAGSFLLYLLVLITYTTGLKMMFSILAQMLPKKANVQSVGTFLVLICTLLGGFIVFPDAVPSFYLWLYWANPMAWALQGLASIEFTSQKYDGIGPDQSVLLASRGFQTDRAFIGYTFAYMIPYTIICTTILGYIMRRVRIQPDRTHAKKKHVAIGVLPNEKPEDINLPFIPVDLTFDKLVYEVMSSTGGEKIRLLNEISGTFKAGRMCALMGSSGAGKTTLLDVIAMRKTSGDTEGEIRLNGFLQERTSFLRCSGYVEQFDVQQPELTVRETVEFCARLRLDEKESKIGNDEGKLKFAAYVLAIMELTDIQNWQVGSFEEGGLSFEQRKRLSIACELAGSPSVIFLDEPTSGLDSRGAIVVMRAMKRIADTGRTVCATIHQPSSAVFQMFDDLLLLKKGGNVVFFGELGQDSANLIEYFESRGAEPIKFGENPAAWMLSCFSGVQAERLMLDWAAVYKNSPQYQKAIVDIEMITESADPAKRLAADQMYVTTFKQRLSLMIQRLFRIYKRSPAYNLARVMIALFYSFIIGSIFLQSGGRRDAWTENELSAVISTMFLSLIVTGITSISMAVPVTQRIRDVFYKHRASGMISHSSLSWALFFAESPYLCTISFFFAIVYYATVGLFDTATQFGMFWIFFILNVATYTYFGQAFICLVKDTATAGALVGALIGYNIFFSGLVVKPQNFEGPFQLGYWTAPGRFALEGLVTTQFNDNDLAVIPEPLSPYFFYLNCNANRTVDGQLEEECYGTIDDYVSYFFGGRFTLDNFQMDVGALFAYMILAKVVTELALRKFNYVNT